ncbi:MAG TPA: DUF2341 domain-containing protein [Chitinispirillaceae bacterium]|nr:DUF2341 domain-containing protein [Chitinispirillaceae bacterium]
MNTFKTGAILISLFLFGACMHGCTKNLAGATTETTNGVTGSILNTDNSVSPNTIVSLFSEGYDPVADIAAVESFKDTTDSSGKFIFKKITPGKYVIVARNPVSKSSACIRGIEIIEDSLTSISPSNLSGTGSISAIFSLREGNDTLGYIYVPGTDVYTYVGSNGPALLNNIPSGTIDEIVFRSHNGQKSNIINKQLTLQPEQLVVIEYPLWKNSRKIVLNTSSSGADISDNLYGFPVLIRLDNSNFSFSQSQPGGADLFFLTTNGKYLPFEIEQWDTASEHAAIWVRTDTLRGNDADQYITMYWGNPDSSTLPVKGVVFDTANGFHGVWHLSESADTVYDATSNRFKGVRKGAVQQQSGIIGYCQNFTGENGYFDLGRICNIEKRDFTASAWIKRSKLTGPQTIFSQSNGGNPSSSYGWVFQFDANKNTHFYTSTADGTDWGKTTGAFDIWSRGEVFIPDTTEWHQVTIVLNRTIKSNCKCFIDGVDVTQIASGQVSDLGNIINDLPLLIGLESDSDYPFAGCIDECTISYSARSDSWIKLSYLNQGIRDMLVQFK